MNIRTAFFTVGLIAAAFTWGTANAIDINMNDMMNPSKWIDRNNDTPYPGNPYGYGTLPGYTGYSPSGYPPAAGYGTTPPNASYPGQIQLAEPPSPHPPGHGTATDPNIAIRDAEIKRLKNRIEQLEQRCGQLQQGYR